MDGVKSVSSLHLFCFLVLFSIGSVSSTDKLTPMLYWPYVDGTVLINSPKFQQVLTNSIKFQYITWNICISKCASVDHLEWLHVASMDFKRRVRIENFTDSNLYDLDTRGILIIKNQTGRNNGAYYRIDISWNDFGVESEYFTLLHFEDQQAHTGPTCPEMSNLTCAVCNCSISNSTLPANDIEIAQTCPACPEVSKLNCTVCNCSNDTQKDEHGTAGMCRDWKVGFGLLLACVILLIIVLIIKFCRSTAPAGPQMPASSDGVNRHGFYIQRAKGWIKEEDVTDSVTLHGVPEASFNRNPIVPANGGLPL